MTMLAVSPREAREIVRKTIEGLMVRQPGTTAEDWLQEAPSIGVEIAKHMRTSELGAWLTRETGILADTTRPGETIERAIRAGIARYLAKLAREVCIEMMVEHVGRQVTQ